MTTKSGTFLGKSSRQHESVPRIPLNLRQIIMAIVWHTNCYRQLQKCLWSFLSAVAELHSYSRPRRPQTGSIAVNDELPLRQPITSLATMVISWWVNRRKGRHAYLISIRKDRDTIIALQWLVAVGISYLVFAVQD